MTAVSLVLFAKVPRPGEVKTRLAREIGPEAASELAGAFLEDGAARFGSLQSARLVVAAAPDAGDDFWKKRFGDPWTIAPQGDGDLGARLWRAFERELRISERVCALGSDHPSLPLGPLAAFLEEPAAVWPARDGGYAALVLSRSFARPELFTGIPWSTGRVFEETLARARAAGIPLAVYPETFDVDCGEDLARLEEDLRGQDPASAGFPRRTWEVLRKIRSLCP